MLDNRQEFCHDSKPVPIPIVDAVVTELFRSKLSDSGRVVIPAELRRALKLLDGEEVVFLRDGDTVRLLSRHAAILAAQAIVNRMIPADADLQSDLRHLRQADDLD